MADIDTIVGHFIYASGEARDKFVDEMRAEIERLTTELDEAKAIGNNLIGEVMAKDSEIRLLGGLLEQALEENRRWNERFKHLREPNHG
jgi:hypothetical protein